MRIRHSFALIMTAALLLLAACAGGSSAPADEAPSAAPPAAEEESAAEPETESSAEADSAAETDAATAAGMRTFVVVPEESKASYLVDEEFFAGALEKLGIAAGEYDVVGSTQEIEGELSLNLAEASIGPSEFRVNIATLSTDQNRRDRWIRENRDGPQLQDHPLALFSATAVENAPEDYVEGTEATFQLLGDMTIRDVTQPVVFDVTATLEGESITGTAIAAMKLTDFGIDPPSFANTLTVADDFFVQVDFTAVDR